MIEKGALICIIEDNMPNRKLFVTLLKRAGFSTADFPDGKSSMDWLKENKPNGLLIDILLPDVNGTEILNSVRSRVEYSDVPAVAVTGFGQKSDAERLLNQGFDGVIPKPVNTTSFVEEMLELMNSRKTD